MARGAPQKPPNRDLIQYDLALRLAPVEALELGAALQAILERSEPVDPQQAAIVVPAVLLPQTACARLLDHRLYPATLTRRFDAWLAAMDPRPIAAALVLFAAVAHLRLPGLGAAGQRRILEAVATFRKRDRIPEPELDARLADAVLWLTAVSALADRLARLAGEPEQLRASLDPAFERLRLHHHSLRAELARLRRRAAERSTPAEGTAELEARVQQLQDHVEELRALLDGDIFDPETDDRARDQPSAVAGPGLTLHHKERRGAGPLVGLPRPAALERQGQHAGGSPDRTDGPRGRARRRPAHRRSAGPDVFPPGRQRRHRRRLHEPSGGRESVRERRGVGRAGLEFARLGPARLYRRLVRFLQERERHGTRER